MADWYYLRGDQPEGPLGREDLIGLLSRGELAADTLVWREGLPEWTRADSLAELGQRAAIPLDAQPTGPPQLSPARPPEAGGYRSMASLVKALSILFVALAILAGALHLLSIVQLLAYPEMITSDEDPGAAAMALGMGLLCSVGLYIPARMTTVVLFCVFVHRANRNARALGAQGMEFTPGWCVGWFFIPVMNLFMPYQAVREIWRASDPLAGPYDWKERPVAGLLRSWWISWIAATMVGCCNNRAANRLAQVALRDNPMIAAAALWGDVASGMLEVAAALLALAVVKSIHRRQEEKAGRLGTAID